MQTEGIVGTLEKVQTKLDQPIPLGYSCATVGSIALQGVRVIGFDPETHAVFVTTRHNSHARFVTAASP